MLLAVPIGKFLSAKKSLAFWVLLEQEKSTIETIRTVVLFVNICMNLFMY